MKFFKKRLISAAIALSVLLCSFSTTAYAAVGNSQTVVTYTAEASYSINIPESININESNMGTIKCTKNTLAYASRLIVAIDSNSTFSEDGNFYLSNSHDTDKLRCEIQSNGNKCSGIDPIVEEWDDGSTTPRQTGQFSVGVLDEAQTADTYKGTIYFKIYTA